MGSAELWWHVCQLRKKEGRSSFGRISSDIPFVDREEAPLGHNIAGETRKQASIRFLQNDLRFSEEFRSSIWAKPVSEKLIKRG
jgi:hypothetical protein